MPALKSYALFGGVHPETSALRHALTYAGVRAPHTGEPYSEAMILGIGGGLGAGYILWEFKEHNAKVLVLGFRKEWQYPVRFMQALCDRLNVSCSVLETGGRGAADRNLRAALERGQAAITWVDRAHMPWFQLPDSLKGHMGHIVIVHEIDDALVRVADLGPVPLTVPVDVFADGRARIVSYKNRVMTVDGASAEPVDLVAVITEGIRDCVEHLSGTSDSFSLPTLRKWARLVNDGKNAKGWRRVFADRTGLYSALKSVFTEVALAGHGGDGLRGLYADFLDEAAPLVGKPALGEVAVTYRALAAQWRDLAEAALPEAVAPLAETKKLLRDQQALLFAQGDAALKSGQPLAARLQDMSREYNRVFPMTDAEIDRLFETLSGQLLALYEREVAAVEQLRMSLD